MIAPILVSLITVAYVLVIITSISIERTRILNKMGELRKENVIDEFFYFGLSSIIMVSIILSFNYVRNLFSVSIVTSIVFSVSYVVFLFVGLRLSYYILSLDKYNDPVEREYRKWSYIILSFLGVLYCFVYIYLA